MTRILAIDPGTTRSAWVRLAGDTLVTFGICDNLTMRDLVATHARLWPGLNDVDAVVIEQVASYGMPVGAEVFETVFWSGRFAEAAHPLPVERLTRLTVKTHLCHSARATDATIRQALIDRYGGTGAIKKGGTLHGVSKDVWAALAVAVTWLDTHTAEKAA